MKFTAEIKIIPHPEIHEPQGHTIVRNLDKLSIDSVNTLRVGKLMHMQLDAKSEVEAHETVDRACKQLLANPITETYSFHLQIVEETPEEEIIEEEAIEEEQPIHEQEEEE